MGTGKDDYYKVYEGHSLTLKAWLVSYGVGAPVLLMTNESIWSSFRQSECASAIALLFLIGVGLQVVLASVNKTIMWYIYRGDDDPEFQLTKCYRWSCTIGDLFWIDIIVDFITILLFGWATYSIFTLMFTTG